MSALSSIASAIAACLAPRPICPLCREHLDEGDHAVCRFWLARRSAPNLKGGIA